MRVWAITNALGEFVRFEEDPMLDLAYLQDGQVARVVDLRDRVPSDARPRRGNRARWQHAADRAGFTLDEWIREYLGAASDPDAGEVAPLPAAVTEAA